MSLQLDFGSILALLILAGIAVTVLVSLWTRRTVSDASKDLIRIQTRLDDQSAAMEARTRAIEESVRGLEKSLAESHFNAQQAVQRSLSDLREHMQAAFGQHQTRFEQRQSEAIKSLQDSLQNGMQIVQRQVTDSLSRSADEIGKRVEGLTQTTDKRLKDISGEVEKRLSEGFEKTTATFADVVKRLALIDEAQKKITELSTNVVSLQEILADKRSRGAFGEVQLNALVRNVLPESSFALQYTLSNGKVADCVLFLPDPSGTVAIDAKFPLESYRRMTDIDLSETERKSAERQFKIDIRKHIQDIAEKYIIRGETSDGAVMFIPAEAVFAEIQAHHPDLVQEAQSSRVWMVSPTTLMAILNTARAVLKDEATRKQVHIIQEHLGGLAKDFDRFQKRMDNLSRHIKQANKDVDEVHTSAQKISSRFEKIESVELEHEAPPELEHEDPPELEHEDPPELNQDRKVEG
ncbi:MAG: DNA recombination protein RmuC [Gammaproteobacteria bacterium]|nr:DNA recombination protein RmuC [Gammaproteobacteria bacterium]